MLATLAMLALAPGSIGPAHATPISWANDVNGSFNDATKWNPATVPSTNDDATVNAGTLLMPVTVTSSQNNTVNTLATGVHDTLSITAGVFTINNATAVIGTNAGTIMVGDNTILLLSGTEHDAGSILLNSAGNLTQLLLAGGQTVTLTGGGTVALSNDAHNLIRDPFLGTGKLVNVDNTIQGAGTIGNAQLALDNQAAHGVTGYGLDRLWEDYRLSVIGHLSIPVWQHSFGLPAGVWWPHLHRILAAFEDLGCAALLS